MQEQIYQKLKDELDTIVDEISILAPVYFDSESANAELNRLKVLLHQLAETQYHYLLELIMNNEEN